MRRRLMLGLLEVGSFLILLAVVLTAMRRLRKVRPLAPQPARGAG